MIPLGGHQGVRVGDNWDGAVFSRNLTSTAVVTPEMVDQERDRRIAAGFQFRGRLIQSDPESLLNITGATIVAGEALRKGNNTYRWFSDEADFVWFDGDNQPLVLDASGMVSLGRAAAEWKSAHIKTGRAIKSMTSIPDDYNADFYWPN